MVVILFIFNFITYVSDSTKDSEAAYVGYHILILGNAFNLSCEWHNLIYGGGGNKKVIIEEEVDDNLYYMKMYIVNQMMKI